MSIRHNIDLQLAILAIKQAEEHELSALNKITSFNSPVSLPVIFEELGLDAVEGNNHLNFGQIGQSSSSALDLDAPNPNAERSTSHAKLRNEASNIKQEVTRNPSKFDSIWPPKLPKKGTLEFKPHNLNPLEPLPDKQARNLLELADLFVSNASHKNNDLISLVNLELASSEPENNRVDEFKILCSSDDPHVPLPPPEPRKPSKNKFVQEQRSSEELIQMEYEELLTRLSTLQQEENILRARIDSNKRSLGSTREELDKEVKINKHKTAALNNAEKDELRMFPSNFFNSKQGKKIEPVAGANAAKSIKATSANHALFESYRVSVREPNIPDQDMP